MAVFQRQQQERVGENKERSRGSHGGIAADLGLPEAQQIFFVAEVEFDLPAPQVGLQDALGRQGAVAADQVSRIPIAETGALAQPVSDRADNEQRELPFPAGVFPAQRRHRAATGVVHRRRIDRWPATSAGGVLLQVD